jgi:hypothetical protein
MPDPSRLIAYAEKHNCAWRWKTERKGGKWEASAMLDAQDGRPAPIYSSGLMDDEQEALDRAIGHAIDNQRWSKRPVGTSAMDLGKRD